MSKNLIFAVENIEIVDDEKAMENDSRYFVSAKIQAFSSDKNRHDMFCSEETLKKTASSIYYKPILYVVDRRTEDFGSHVSPDIARPAGVVLHDSAEFQRLEDGRLSLVVSVKIWKRYASQAIDIFKRDGGYKKVSVELDLLDYDMQPDGLMEMKDFQYVGVAILGDAITEASPGAHIAIASFAEEDRAFKEALLLEFSTRYDAIDFRVPDKIKENCSLGLELSKKHGGGNPRILSHARYLIKNLEVTPNRAFLIFKDFKFGDVEVTDLESPSEEHIVYLLLGGREGREWVASICEKMDELDDQSLSYFDNMVFFPYKKIEDINPSLKGIDPQLSLEQANQIAEVADQLIKGGKEASEAWGTAISNFKKSHHQENEKWVENSEQADNGGEEYVEVTNMEKDELENIEEEIKEPMGEEEVLEDLTEEVFSEEKPDESEEEDSKDESEEDVDDDSEDADEDEVEEEKYGFDKDIVMSLVADEEIKLVLSEEFGKEEAEFDKIASLMFKVLVGMSAQIEAFSKENEDLKEYKKSIEEKEFAFIVASTLNDLSTEIKIPSEVLEEMKESSKEYTLETIGSWKNEVRAKALDFAINSKRDVETMTKMAFPWTKTVEGGKEDSIWDKINK